MRSYVRACTLDIASVNLYKKSLIRYQLLYDSLNVKFSLIVPIMRQFRKQCHVRNSSVYRHSFSTVVQQGLLDMPTRMLSYTDSFAMILATVQAHILQNGCSVLVWRGKIRQNAVCMRATCNSIHRINKNRRIFISIISPSFIDHVQ